MRKGAGGEVGRGLYTRIPGTVSLGSYSFLTRFRPAKNEKTMQSRATFSSRTPDWRIFPCRKVPRT